MHTALRILFFAPLFLILGYACGNEAVPEPRPRGFPRVDFPEKAYQTFDTTFCDFTFEYPAYAEVIQEADFFGEASLHPCWFDLYVPSLNGRVHCSYVPVEDKAHFAQLHNDAFKMTYKHSIKARSIEETPFRNQYGVSGFTFFLEGPVASSYMFYLTDSTDHFLRGSLYFDTQARPDSLRPVMEFLKEDVEHMLQTFQWQE